VRTHRYAAAIILSFLGVAAPPAVLRAQEAPSAAQQERKLIAVLKSDAPLFDKARACEQLAIVGTPKAVPVLAGMLDDERLGDYARLAMEPIEDPSVDDAFRRAMGSLKGRRLAGVVNSIGVRRDVKAVAGLRKLLGDPTSGVGAEVLAALGRIATDEAIQAVRQTLTKGPAELRPVAADACLVAAERLLSRSKPEEAAALYDAVCRADLPGHLTAAATYHAIVVRGAAGVGLLVEQIRSDNAVLRGAALRAARALPAAEVTRALVSELGKSRPDVQVLLIELLAERKDRSVRQAISRLAASPSLAVRAESLTALGRIGDASSSSVLLKAAGGGGKEAAIARSSLRTLGGEGVDAAILAGMKQAQGELRVELIDVLADRRYNAAVPALLGEAAAADEGLAKAAFKALSVLAGAKDIPAMVKLLLAAEPGPAASEAENTIVLVAAGVADLARRADPVLSAMPRARKPAQRAALLRVLGRLGGPKAYQIVVKATTDADATVKDAAVRALASWPDGAAEGALLEIAKGAPSEVHRVLALRGYVRLLGLAEGRTPRQTAQKYVEAMAVVRRADTRKTVLAGLAGVAHADALKLAMAHVDDAGAGPEAAAAAVAIARAIAGTDRIAARAAMEKLLAAKKGTRIAAQASQIIATIDKFADAITAWRVAGPFVKKGMNYSQLFNVVFEPEKPHAKGVVWRALPAATDPKRPWILDLKRALGGDQRAAYVLTWVHSDKAQPARLEMGSDDGIKAWLNGELVHAKNAARAAIPYTDKVNVMLKAGWNPLMLKITQNNVPWEFCARVATREGKELEGIRIDATHEGDWKLPAGAAAKAAPAPKDPPATMPSLPARDAMLPRGDSTRVLSVACRGR
jgi:hypothetical protein